MMNIMQIICNIAMNFVILDFALAVSALVLLCVLVFFFIKVRHNKL